MDVRIKKKNELYLIIECDYNIKYQICDNYTFEVPGHKFMPAYKHGMWDGKIRLFSFTTGQIYYGLLHDLIEFLKENNYTYEIEEGIDTCSDFDIDAYIKTLNPPFEIAEHQIETIKQCISNHRKLIISPTSSGKTFSLYAISNYYKDFCKVLIIFPNTSLVMQTRLEFINYGMDARNLHEIYEDKEKNTHKPIVLSTWQGIHTQPKSYFQQYDAVIVDECFPPETEILTNRGFIRFDCLDKTELVAQYNSDTNEISFTKPIRYIENDHSGKLIGATSDRISLTTTSHHEILLFNKTNPVKLFHKDISYNNSWTIKTCGLTTSNIKTELTELDKLLIAYQAVGTSTNLDGILTLEFNFSKQCKIDKFLDIMSRGNFEFKEVTGECNLETSRRFLVSNIQYAYEDISKNFKLEELSVDVCRQIIEEMVCWGGDIIKNGLYCYSSDIKSNIDFYQSVAIMCNYHTTIQIDNILVIDKNKDKVSCRDIIKSEIDYIGKVYCVEVPTGNIVIRRNGKVAITGNCHTAAAKSLTNIMQNLDNCKYRFGFTGTLDGTKINKLQLIGLFGDYNRVITTKKLIDNKHISDVRIKILLIKHKYKMFDSYNEELEYIITNPQRNKFIQNLVSKLKGNTLVLFSRVEQQGLPLYERFSKNLTHKNIHLVYGDIKTDKREEIRQIVETQDNAIIVASYQTYQQGINIKNLHNIVFASPNKSRIRNLQSIGRGLRLHKSKTIATIYDIADDISIGERKNHTLKHMMDRINYYSEEELNFDIVEINMNKN